MRIRGSLVTLGSDLQEPAALWAFRGEVKRVVGSLEKRFSAKSYLRRLKESAAYLLPGRRGGGGDNQLPARH